MDVKLTAFAEALQGFADLTALDMTALATTLDARIIDGLENGKAQKFEYTMELCWKAVKVALCEQEGIDEASPKKVSSPGISPAMCPRRITSHSSRPWMTATSSATSMIKTSSTRSSPDSRTTLRS